MRKLHDIIKFDAPPPEPEPLDVWVKQRTAASRMGFIQSTTDFDPKVLSELTKERTRLFLLCDELNCWLD